jgi:hypothetical protein
VINNPTIIAGALIAGAILLNGYLPKAQENQQRYQLSAAGTGQTVWRMDTRNGQISLCGSVLDGASLSKMQAQQDEALVNAMQNSSKDAQAKIVDETQQFHKLSDPRCVLSGQWEKNRGETAGACRPKNSAAAPAADGLARAGP